MVCFDAEENSHRRIGSITREVAPEEKYSVDSTQIRMAQTAVGHHRRIQRIRISSQEEMWNVRAASEASRRKNYSIR